MAVFDWSTIVYIVFTLLIGLLVLPAVGWLLVLYVKYHGCPERRWKGRVLDLLAAARKRANEQNRALGRFRDEERAEANCLRKEQFRSYLSSISVTELDAYPGIGPATIDKLRRTGYFNLETLGSPPTRISGVGEKRLGQIHAAIHDLLRKARSTFDSGSCTHARALAGKLNSVSAKYEALRVQAQARAAAAKAVIDGLLGPLAAVRQVTFWAWFRRTSEQPLVSPQVMDAVLPDLETTVRAADGAYPCHATTTSGWWSSPAPVAPADVPANLVQASIRPVTATQSTAPLPTSGVPVVATVARAAPLPEGTVAVVAPPARPPNRGLLLDPPLPEDTAAVVAPLPGNPPPSEADIFCSPRRLLVPVERSMPWKPSASQADIRDVAKQAVAPGNRVRPPVNPLPAVEPTAPSPAQAIPVAAVAPSASLSPIPVATIPSPGSAPPSQAEIREVAKETVVHHTHATALSRVV